MKYRLVCLTFCSSKNGLFDSAIVLLFENAVSVPARDLPVV